jgi:hypothetical protein
MAFGRVRLKGTGKAGHKSSRWLPRADAKWYSKKKRRREDKRATADGG